MKNYLLSGNMNDKVLELLKKDLIHAKTLVAISASKNTDKNDMYFWEGNEKHPAITTIFKEISNIKNYYLLDSRKNGEEAKKIIKTADVIYLTGGDPMIQLEYIKENGLDKLLKLFTGIVIGLSAGSMNQSKMVYYRSDEDNATSSLYEGLGLVDVTIEPHYDIENNEQVQEHQKWSKKLPIIGLPNDSFIVVNKDKIKIYGKSYQYYG